jgi:hypothetical protein
MEASLYIVESFQLIMYRISSLKNLGHQVKPRIIHTYVFENDTVLL